MQPRTVLLVIPRLEYSGAARQLMLLAGGLPRELFRVHVAVLGTATPWVDELRAAGVAVETLGWRRPFDVWPFFALRRLVRTQRPDIVHVWGAAALRALALAGSRRPSRLLVSAALPPVRSPGGLDRRLLQRAGGVIAFGAAEAVRYRLLGVQESRLTVVAPAMNVPADTIEPAQVPGVTAGERVLLGIGPIELHRGFREAVWAFDILRHLYSDLHLVLLGNGSDRPRVELFARHARVTKHVHFLGPRVDLAPLLRLAEVVWVPSRQGGGTGAALEAMASGRAVVASRCPDLAEVVVDGETGFLVEPNNKAALARQTRFLLDDPSLRQRLGAAGRQRVIDHFSVGQFVEACARRYVLANGRC
jgi:glycosyltransferase involved in cell wall biosynthesis